MIWMLIFWLQFGYKIWKYKQMIVVCILNSIFHRQNIRQKIVLLPLISYQYVSAIVGTGQWESRFWLFAMVAGDYSNQSQSSFL